MGKRTLATAQVSPMIQQLYQISSQINLQIFSLINKFLTATFIVKTCGSIDLFIAFVFSSTYQPIMLQFRTWMNSQSVHCLRTLSLGLQSAEILEPAPIVSAPIPDDPLYNGLLCLY